ncbi:MAG: RNA polymerase-binding protein DksA [Hydrogenophaga sp.]|nr:RNA polymerase-binding protein DksA [Hydrogenophaga sp.]
MKAPAKSTATQRKPAAAVGKNRSAPAAKKVAGKPTPAKKATTKPVTKSTAAKTVAKKPVAKVAAKPVTKTVKSVAKPVTKTPVKKVAKSVAKPAVKSTASTASAKAVTKVTKPAATKVAVVKQPAATPKSQPPVRPAKAANKVAPVAAPTPSPSVIEPAPRPLGKRAAKRMMIEQMTQAVVVPTHSPDAAKATFSLSNERVMTAPAPSAIKKDPKRANNWKTVPVDQLTDQDVLSMPDSEYMNDVQLAFFRRKLVQLKDDMLANAGETTEHLREDTVVVPDPADRATIEEEHALELRTRDRERKLLKKIEQAIVRIDGGDYGYCDETGEPIGVGRLMARPTASLSLEAQQRRELKQKMFGD